MEDIINAFQKKFFKVFFGKNKSLLAGKVSKPSSIIMKKLKLKIFAQL